MQFVIYYYSFNYDFSSVDHFRRNPAVGPSQARPLTQRMSTVRKFFTKSKIGDHGSDVALRISHRQQNIMRFDVAMN